MTAEKRRARPAARPSTIGSTPKRNTVENKPIHIALQVRRLRQRLGVTEAMAIAIAPLAFGEVAQ